MIKKQEIQIQRKYFLNFRILDQQVKDGNNDNSFNLKMLTLPDGITQEIFKLILEFSLNQTSENVLKIIVVKIWSECQSNHFKLHN
jgi:hypothetical protein